MSKPYRIAVGGFHIECSEFTPYRSGEAAFRIRRGQELLDSHPWITGDTSAIDAARLERFGAIERIEGVEWVPLTYAGALPGGPVSFAHCSSRPITRNLSMPCCSPFMAPRAWWTWRTARA